MTKFIFIRHTNSVQTKQLSPSQWTISKEGEENIYRTVATIEELKELNYVYCSEEKKAILTAQGIVKALNKEQEIKIITDKRLNEVNRDKGIFFESHQLFKQAVKESFQQMSQHIHSWEPATTALSRFENFMDELKAREEESTKTIGIVSHGTIMSLYFAKIGGYDNDPEQLYQKWSTTTFCGWGKIVDGIIVRNLT